MLRILRGEMEMSVNHGKTKKLQDGGMVCNR